MTLTYLELARARRIFWLIVGEKKREALGGLLGGQGAIPAARVHAEDSLVIADEAAAAGRR
jgi:6-phosphogluconolactonase/glucosamine-6-phosphate isomerase/deaminase